MELQDRFEVLAVLGEGGFGKVLRCRDRELGREVAVKLLSTRLTTPEDRRRFLREAEATGRVDHPGVVRVLASGVTEDGSDAYLVYELLEGRDLGRTLHETGPLPRAELARIGAAVAEALHAAHEAGVVHRDVKPANVMLPEGGLPVLVDFGIARVTDAGTQLTAEGILLGTPAYMAPELLLGRPPGPASDQFAWAACLVELAGGEPVYGCRDPAGVIRALAGRHPPSVDAAAKERLGPLTGAVERALATEPERRFPDMTAFGRALGDDQPLRTTRPTRSPPTRGARWVPAILCLALFVGYLSRPEGSVPATAPSPAPAATPQTSPHARRLRKALDELEALLPEDLREIQEGYSDQEIDQAYHSMISLRFTDAHARMLRAALPWMAERGPKELEEDFGRLTFVVGSLLRKLKSRLDTGTGITRAAITMFSNRHRDGLLEGWDPAAIRDRFGAVRRDVADFLCRLDASGALNLDQLLTARWLYGTFGVLDDDERCPGARGRTLRYFEIFRRGARGSESWLVRHHLVWFLARKYLGSELDFPTRIEALEEQVRWALHQESTREIRTLRGDLLTELWRLVFRFPQAPREHIASLSDLLLKSFEREGRAARRAVRVARRRIEVVRDSFLYVKAPEVKVLLGRLDALLEVSSAERGP